MDTKKQAENLQLVEFLETFLPVIDSRIPTKINNGGCGIFAKNLYDKLIQMGFEVKLVYIASEEEQPIIERVIKNNKYEKGEKRSGFQHCMVSLGDYIYFDSTGVTHPPQLLEKASKGNKKADERLYVGEISEENLQIYNDHIDSWSQIFDRDCIPQIEEELSKLPEEFEKFKKEGRMDFTIQDSIKYTDHTIEWIKKARIMSLFGN